MKITKKMNLLIFTLVALLISALPVQKAHAVYGIQHPVAGLIVVGAIGAPIGGAGAVLSLGFAAAADSGSAVGWIAAMFGGLAISIASIVALDETSNSIVFNEMTEEQAQRFELNSDEYIAFNESLPMINGILEVLSNSYDSGTDSGLNLEKVNQIKVEWNELSQGLLVPGAKKAVEKIASTFTNASK